MYVSIDLVEEIIERQLRKYKNKIIDKNKVQDFSLNLLKRITRKIQTKLKLSVQRNWFQTNVSGRCMCTDGIAGT